MRTIASQKLGRDVSAMESSVSQRSAAPWRYTAMTAPSGTLRRITQRSAMPASESVTGSACRSSCSTFFPVIKETPQSPRSTPPSHAAYCTA